MDKLFKSLLILTPVTLVANYSHLSPTLIFFLAAVAIIPLARYIGESTEELASHTNSAVGGLLNATFGNATELIIGIFALNAGLIEVVKASIIGSMLGNLLLVLGFSMFFGGLKRDKQTFNRAGILAASSTLLVSVIALSIPAILSKTAPDISSNTLQHLSLFVSIALICMYAASLTFSLFTHQHLYDTEVGKHEATWKLSTSIIVLATTTVAVAWVSSILVDSIQPLIKELGWSELFVGVIIIAIIGNVAEHISAVTIAMKNRMDLSIQIAMGSATQIAMLIAPLLVLISLATSRSMNLVFSTFELVAVFMSVLIVNFVVADGESNWLEGLQLIVAYTIIGAGFYFYT